MASEPKTDVPGRHKGVAMRQDWSNIRPEKEPAAKGAVGKESASCFIFTPRPFVLCCVLCDMAK